jgi:hypothetical protein
MRFSTVRLGFPLLAMAAVLATSPARTQSVVLRGAEEGQGVLRPRGQAECYVVTPGHVVQNAPPPIAVTGDRGERATAELRQSYPGIDLAVVELATGWGFFCPEWDIPKDLQAMLADPSIEAVLRTREEDGSITFFPVWIRNVAADHVSVLARLPGDQITQGMSGSQLLIQGRFAGMLLSVEASRGTGRVIRSDVVDRHVRSFFARADTGGAAVPSLPPSEPNLWLRTDQGTLIGDRNTAFGVQEQWNSAIRVSVNGTSHDIFPGARLPYPDSRGDCYIVYLRTEDPTPGDSLNGDARHGFRLYCNER